jgi:hypothetical protein
MSVPAAEKCVLDESIAQIQKAEALVNSFDEKMVRSTMSHALCHDLLSSGASYIEALLEGHLLSEREGRESLQGIEKNVHLVSQCNLDVHPGELSEDERKQVLEKMTGSTASDETHEGGGFLRNVTHGMGLQRRRSSVPGKLL